MLVHEIHAFTAPGFLGNPAGVCLIPPGLPDRDLQSVAHQMGLSETAFLIPEGPNRFHLRWFTPTTEVALCGHATLASAHWLWESGNASRQEPIEFMTLSGLLVTRPEGPVILMDFPAKPPVFTSLFDELISGLGIKPVFTGRSVFDLMVVVRTEEEVRRFVPDLDAIRQSGVRGLILTAPSGSADYDFVSRFFAPAAGVDEDPVTGSAHCTLGPYWMTLLAKNPVTGLQVSGRGGVVKVRIHGDRVDLIGSAVTAGQRDIEPKAV